MTDSSSNAKGVIFKNIINFTAMSVGMGILSLPGAITMAGWVFGTAAFFLSGAISAYCGILLLRCTTIYHKIESTPNRVLSYPEVGRLAFGTPGALISYIAAYFTTFGTATLFIILASEQFENLFGDSIMDRKLWSLIFIGCCLPFSYIKKLDHVAFVSFFGVASIFIVLGVCIFYSIYLKVAGKLDDSDTGNEMYFDSDQSHSLLPANPEDLARAFVSISFCFGGTAVFPVIIESMGVHAPKFNYTLFIGTLIELCVFLSIAVVNFAIFGNFILTKENFSDVLPQGWAQSLVAVMLLVHLIPAFIIYLNSGFLRFELVIAKASDTPKIEFLKRFLVRTFIIAVLYGIAISVPYFGDVMGLVGATSITLATFILPCVFYLAIFRFGKRHNVPYNNLLDTTSNKTSSTEDNEVATVDNCSLKERSAPVYAADQKEKDKQQKKPAAEGNATMQLQSVEFDGAIDNKELEAENDLSQDYNVSNLEVVFIICIIIFTAFIGTVGTYTSIARLVQDFQN